MLVYVCVCVYIYMCVCVRDNLREREDRRRETCREKRAAE